MRVIKSYAVSLMIIVLFGCSETKIIQKYGLTPPSIEVKDNKAFISGTLGADFYDLFVKELEKHPEIETLVLMDIPGSINDEWNLKACQLVYERGFNTELLSNSIVESGGTDLFVSGKKLIIAEGAKIGVHAWAGAKKTALDYPKDHKSHKMFLDFYKKIDIDTSFYWFTLNAAPAHEMHFMTKEEINRYFMNKLK